MNLFKKMANTWNTSNISSRFYLTAKLCLAIVALIIFVARTTNIDSLLWLVAIPLVLLMAGFLVWASPKLLTFSRSRVGVMPLIALHALLLPVCVGWARQIVGAALQLPPQSFDVTVACIAVLVVPVLWAVVAACVFLPAGFSVILVAMFGRFLLPLVSLFMPPFAEQAWTALLQRYQAWEDNSTDHAIGSVVSCVLILAMVAAYQSAVVSPQFVRLVAYGLDFSSAYDYPGIDKQRRMRLLDNGYVVYGHRDGLDVQFEVAQVRPASDVAPELGSSALPHAGSTANSKAGAK